jgi:hypothetical protein
MEDDLDMSMRAPYISMSESSELPMLIAEDLMWGAQPDLKLSLNVNRKTEMNPPENEMKTYQQQQQNKSSTITESSLASLLCSQLLQHHQQQMQQQQQQTEQQINLNQHPEIKIEIMDQSIINSNNNQEKRMGLLTFSSSLKEFSKFFFDYFRNGTD